MITDRFCKSLYAWLLILSIFTCAKDSQNTTPIAFGPNNQPDLNNQNFYLTILQTSFPQYLHSPNYEQIRATAILALLKSQMSESDFQQFWHNLHLQKYGVSTDYLKNALHQKNFEELESWIINNKNLTKKQAINIWTDFCNPKHFKNEKKARGYQAIEKKHNQHELDAAKHQELARQKTQEIKKYKSDQNKNAIVLSRDLELLQEQYQPPQKYLCESIDSAILHQREQALQKTIAQNYTQHKQSYYLNAQTEGYLRSHDLQPADYTSCFGTALQQQLHSEVCQLFDHIAQQKNNLLFATDAINFTDAAHDQNVKEQIATATTLADIAWTLAAIPLGIFESAQDAVMLPLHAPQIIKGLGQALYFVVETAVINDLATVTQWPRAQQDRDVRNALIKQGIVLAASAIYNATWHDKIKGTTRLIADFYVPGKIFHATGHLFAGVTAQSKKLRSLENVASMMDHDSDFAEMIEEIMEATKRLEPATPEGLKGQMLVKCMEAESTIPKIAKTIIKFNKDTYPHYLNKFSENLNDIIHIFRNKFGKFKDTLETRKKLLDMVRDKSKCFGQDDHGVVSYSMIELDGTQWWAEVNPNNYTIRNCGFNNPGKHRTWSQDTGFKMNLLKGKND